MNAIDAQWWLNNRAKIIAALERKGLRIVSNAERVWLAPTPSPKSLCGNDAETDAEKTKEKPLKSTA